MTPQQAQQLLDAISVPIAPVKRNNAYTARLIWATLVMLGMVIAYALLIFFLLWFIYAYGFASRPVSYGYRRPSIFLTLISWFPIFVVVCVLIALIKPIFARSESAMAPFELTRAHEPFLFEFIARLCKSVGAPPPVSITVDENANAGASYIRGLFDDRLRLTIGLPLVLGLSTRQLAGVMAHEFGHFCQTTGMKMTYLIRLINHWFSAAAFERDAWDALLERWSKQLDVRVSWILWIARGAIYLARLMLIGLVLVGHTFCSRLLREMEFDADRVETRLAGALNFARTCRQLQLLNFCQAAAMDELDRYRREARLPDNLPAVIVSNIDRIKPDKCQEMEKALLELKTEWGDSHPSDRDRIENAAREKTDGSFRIELPASVLFTDIQGLCRVVTLKIYQHAFGAGFNPKTVRATDQILAVKNVEVAEGEAGLRFILDQFCGYHTFHLPRFKLGEAMDAKQYRTNTEIRRRNLLDSLAGYRVICKQENDLMDALIEVAGARRLIEAGFDLSQAKGNFAANNLHDTHRRAEQLAHQEKQIKESLRGFRQLLGYRLIDALEFLRSEKIIAKTGLPPAVVHEVAGILQLMEIIVSQKQSYEQLVFDTQVIFFLLGACEIRVDARVEKSIMAACQRVHYLLSGMHLATARVYYPFEHGRGKITLAEFFLPEIPKADDIENLVSSVMDFKSNVDLCLKRCVARLGTLAEKVEGAFGFTPIDYSSDVLLAEEIPLPP